MICWSVIDGRCEARDAPQIGKAACHTCCQTRTTTLGNARMGVYFSRRSATNSRRELDDGKAPFNARDQTP